MKVYVCRQLRCCVRAAEVCGTHNTRGGTRTRNLLLRREAPYPLGHTNVTLSYKSHFYSKSEAQGAGYFVRNFGVGSPFRSPPCEPPMHDVFALLSELQTFVRNSNMCHLRSRTSLELKLRKPTTDANEMDTLGIEPRAFRMRSGCDTTTPCAP